MNQLRFILLHFFNVRQQSGAPGSPCGRQVASLPASNNVSTSLLGRSLKLQPTATKEWRRSAILLRRCHLYSFYKLLVENFCQMVSARRRMRRVILYQSKIDSQTINTHQLVFVNILYAQLKTGSCQSVAI